MEGCVHGNSWGHPGDKHLVMQLIDDDLAALKDDMVGVVGASASVGAPFLSDDLNIKRLSASTIPAEFRIPKAIFSPTRRWPR